ncbi:hypothetical protein HPB48_018017 [Haemaphysalis longicornis]|uniref:DUF6570 domain-containing protein n=1 Tax=Haemaphysalis longicornis TaxID=44386 RepID=A0A9J6FH69_HAELO|nr:hypothetical protein HPB48_018017 [Haemaphysalis longicornis]
MIAGVPDAEQREVAAGVWRRCISSEEVEQEPVCGTCRDSLFKGTVPRFATISGYVYPPIPKHLPKLNVVEERPRLPFMSILRLTFFNKENRRQYAIKEQVINVPINVQETLQRLPRNTSDDMAIEVHLKRLLLFKTYVPTWPSEEGQREGLASLSGQHRALQTSRRARRRSPTPFNTRRSHPRRTTARAR